MYYSKYGRTVLHRQYIVHRYSPLFALAVRTFTANSFTAPNKHLKCKHTGSNLNIERHRDDLNQRPE